MTRESKPALDEARIAAYLRGDLSEGARTEVETLMDREPKWLSVLAHLAADLDASSQGSLTGEGASIRGLRRAASIRLHPGQLVGRFVVERALGRGGMGTVYAAHDPTLGRDVALKLLHATDQADQQRLAAEARTLAQINHPHVVTVHDVSPWQARMFLAMELIEGETLLAWRMRTAPSWQQVVDVYIEAATGLAAAHAVGIVHRDIKPTNIMMTDEGRVVVVDFGLALDMSSMDTLSQSTLSHVGTPAYMAPEQRRGEPSTGASDQFSLCVALYEALMGVLPAASSTDRPAPFGSLARVPRRMHGVLSRGLAQDPDRRHPSMNALVEALRATRRSNVWPIPAAVTMVVVAATLWPAAPQESTCSGGANVLARTWNPTRRDAVGQALTSLGGDWSVRVARTALDDLDTYAQTWTTAHREACETTQDDKQLGTRMACLDRRRRALDAVVTVLLDANDDVGMHAVEAVAGLDGVDSCLQGTGSNEGPSSSDAELIRDRLALGETLRESSQLDLARQHAHAALRSSTKISSAYLEADARLLLGWIEHDAGRFEEAQEQLRLGLAAATVSHNDAAVSTALHRLAWVVGYKLGRHVEGLELCDQSEAWSVRLGGRVQDDVARAMARGWIAHEKGAFEEAAKHFESVVQLDRGTDHAAEFDAALALNGLGATRLSAGDLDGAQSAFETAAARLSARLGPTHPKVGRVHSNRGSVLRALGRPEDALALFEQARTIFVDAHGEEHTLVGQVLINTTVVLNDLGRHEDALRTSHEAIRVVRASVGEQHLLVARAYVVRGDSYSSLGRYEEAASELLRALAMQSELLGEEHPSLGVTLSNLSIAYDHLGRLDDAAQQQRRALDLLVAANGETHELVATGRMNLGYLEHRRGRSEYALGLYALAIEHGAVYTVPMALLGFAEILLALDRPKEAIAPLERARELLIDAPVSFGSRADALHMLAMARWQSGDRQAARRAAQEAAAAIQDHDTDELREAIDTWQTAH